jgi:hypothetical protein
MQRIIHTTVLALVAAASIASAQVGTFESRRSQTSSVDYYVSNNGVFGHNAESNGPGLQYPRDATREYIFGSGIWFGAQKSVDDTLRKLVFVTYNPNSAASWAMPGEYTTADSTVEDGRLYYSGDFDHRTGAYQGPSSSPAWPLWLASGMSATTRTPGIYEHDTSSRAIGARYTLASFLPNVDEEYVTRFHDGVLGRYEGFRDAFGFPLGLQFQQNVYSWRSGLYRSAVVLQYEVVNVSDDTLYDCVLAQVTDPDLGVALNDHTTVYHGADGTVRAAIVTTDESEGDEGYEALATVLLESPAIGDPFGAHAGFIDNMRRDDMAMAHEIYNYTDWALEGDPQTLTERYDMLAREGRDGDAGPGDKRTVIAGRPFSMRPGDTAHFAIAFAVIDTAFGRVRTGDAGRSTPKVAPGGLSSSGFDGFIASIVSDYARGTFQSEPLSVRDDAATLGSTMTLGPNPAVSASTLSFAIAEPAVVDVSIVSTMGERVWHTELGRVDAGAHRASLDVSALPTGAYVVVVRFGTDRRSVMLNVTR